ncbi:MAG: UTP--glucose-1-phosphate uridylyltransferase [Syntrophorhabdaceae bacterium]|nr:UTP--glucose-1-phosphate uridylyltransferase [Syntrophorhabdaceae bacterium]
MKEKILEKLKLYNQQHIIDHYMGLTGDEQNRLLNLLDYFDLDLIFRIYGDFLKAVTKKEGLKISPANIVPLPKTPQEEAIREKARDLGEKLIKNNKIAVLIVAGGQGTRLGYDGPKGTFKISPVKGKTLFQLFTEQVMAISKRYSARIPLIIMTSHENDEDTRTFFKDNRFFGLGEDNIYFFRQGMLPTLTPDGKLIIKDRGQIATNPDGHGGSLKALNDSGLLDMLLADGYTELFYCQVDNPLVKIADPVFLGYHYMSESEASTKVVRRRNVEEKVGVYLNFNGQDGIIEYSDLDPSYMKALDEKGEILYWAGNTAIHIFSLPFVKRLNSHGYALPYHCAKKTMDIKTPEGNDNTIDVWKFETFVFDAIPLAKKTCAIEVKREEEFSPVKNMTGVDSPEKARDDMCALFRRWVEGAGAKVKDHIKIEVSPLFAIDYQEFKNKFNGKGVTIEDDIYFGD